MTYRTPEAFRRALDDRLVMLAREAGLPIDRLRKYAAFERFLARLEMVTPRTWVLKGGLALNCRLGRYSRPSRDIDLAHAVGADDALVQLIAAAGAETRPDDHFRFRPSLHDHAPHTADGSLRLRLETQLAGRLYDLASIDVVTEADIVGRAEMLAVPSLLGFAELPPVTMLVTPVERHLADKVDAYLRGHINARAISTREKDLADIVLLAASERPRAGVLRYELDHVLVAERSVPTALPAPPATWGRAYRTLAAQLGLQERTVVEAFERARSLLDPVLSGAVPDEARWNAAASTWELPSGAPSRGKLSALMRASTYPLVDAAEAAELVLAHTRVLAAEEVHLADCLGRVLAEDLVAPAELPAFPASAVDGYAIRSADGGGRLRVVGESAAGRPFTGELPPGAAARILTGGVLPAGADTVVMVEDVEHGPDWVVVPEGCPAGRNFHRPGDDLGRGELVLRGGQPLGAAELGLAAALGLPRLWVHRRPRVALMSTGDELVEVGTEPGPGQVVDSNRWALLAALREAGAVVTLLGVAPDRPEALRALVVEAQGGHDVLVTSGGVSVGTHDLVKPLLESLGEVHLGRVRLKPGKPFTFATLAEGRLAFGLPGFPVSSLVTFEVFVRPALRRMQGFTAVQRPTLRVRLGYDARSSVDRTEYQRVTLLREDGELVARSTGSQSSSRLMSLAGAHALVRVPAGETGIAAGSVVDAMVLSLPD